MEMVLLQFVSKCFGLNSFLRARWLWQWLVRSHDA